MKIILKKHVDNLGSQGDIIIVKAGYARNFLFPYGKAVQATTQNILEFKQYNIELERLENKKLFDAQLKADKISKMKFVISAKSGENNKLFGSIGSKDVANIIKLQSGIDIDKRNVCIKLNTIRYLGNYEVVLNLHSTLKVNILVSVIST